MNRTRDIFFPRFFSWEHQHSAYKKKKKKKNTLSYLSLLFHQAEHDLLTTKSSEGRRPQRCGLCVRSMRRLLSRDAREPKTLLALLLLFLNLKKIPFSIPLSSDLQFPLPILSLPILNSIFRSSLSFLFSDPQFPLSILKKRTSLLLSSFPLNEQEPRLSFLFYLVFLPSDFASISL